MFEYPALKQFFNLLRASHDSNKAAAMHMRRLQTIIYDSGGANSNFKQILPH